MFKISASAQTRTEKDSCRWPQLKCHANWQSKRMRLFLRPTTILMASKGEAGGGRYLDFGVVTAGRYTALHAGLPMGSPDTTWQTLQQKEKSPRLSNWGATNGFTALEADHHFIQATSNSKNYLLANAIDGAPIGQASGIFDQQRLPRTLRSRSVRIGPLSALKKRFRRQPVRLTAAFSHQTVH